MSQFERKRLFVITLSLFALSNALAAVASNFWVMAFARFIPSLALPVFWSLASETAVQIMGHEKAGKAISMVGFGVVLATIFGIPIGTLIANAYGWRSAFVVLSLLALGKCCRCAKNSKTTANGHELTRKLIGLKGVEPQSGEETIA